MRYLITYESALPAIQSLVGSRYEVITLEAAQNGHLDEIRASNGVLCWPDYLDSDSLMEAFAAMVREFVEDVKVIDAPERGDPISPEAMVGWDFAKLKKHLSDEKRLRIIERTSHGEAGENQSSAGETATPPALPPVSDAPDEGYSPFPKPAAQAKAAVSSPSAPDASEFTPDPPSWVMETPPDDAYEARRPLSAAEAYIPYQNPENPSDWPESPSDWWTEGKVPEMLPELMPPCLSDYICQESETMGADRGIMAMYAIGFCAGALADTHVLQVKPDNPRWIQPARLWLMIIGSSASKKSPVLTEIRAPAWKLEIAMREKSIADVDRWTDDVKTYEKQHEAYISKRAKGEPSDAPIKPIPANRERYMVGNATVESLADVLIDNPRGVVNVMDEIVSVLKGLGQYKKGGNDKEAYLMGFDGGPYPIDRKGRAELIPNFGWSFIGGTQQSKIRDVAASLRLEGDGFAARFLPYIARNATEDLDRPSHHAGHAHFEDIITRLWEMQSQGPVVFSPEAQQIRRQFSSWAWNAAKGEWLGESLRAAVSKYDTQYARMCLTYHAIACANRHSAYLDHEIPSEVATQVAKLFQECLYQHAENFYLHILDSSSDLMLAVRKIAGKILAKGVRTIDPTWLAQSWTGWRKLRDFERRAILGIMAEGGWIRTNDRRGYIPGISIKYDVHHKLQDIFPHYTVIEKSYLDSMAERRAERMAGEDG